MVDDVQGVPAGRPASACSCACGRVVLARRLICLKKVAWNSWSSSFAALLVAAPDPRSAFRHLRFVFRARLIGRGDSQSPAAAARLVAAVPHAWEPANLR